MSEQWFLDQARLGNVYHAHNTSAGAVTVLSTTCTGLVLSNPLGSNVNLIIKNMAFVGTTLAALGEIGVAVSAAKAVAVQTGTAAVIHNAKLNGSNSNIGKAHVLSIATLLTTPVWIRPMGLDNVTAAVTGYKAFEANFDGTLIVPPGMYACFAALATARTGMCSVTWAEVPE